MDFHIPDTPKSKSRNNVSFKKENEEEDTRENKKYKIRLSEEEIKPPIREREVDFEDYMVRNLTILLKKVEGLENDNKELKSKLDIINNNFTLMVKTFENKTLSYENKELKSKLDIMNNDFILMAKTFENKALSYEDKMKKISKIQAENPNNKVIIERISSDGIVRIPHKDGTIIYMI